MTKIYLLVEGYVKDGGKSVQSSVGLVVDGDIKIIVDPGMTKNPNAIEETLSKHKLSTDDINWVAITHHHPDHTRWMGKFKNAKVIDHWAIYDNDQWIDTNGEYQISENVRVIPLPGHTKEDVAILVENVENVEPGRKAKVAFCHLWWFEGKDDDPLAQDEDSLKESREKISKMAECIVPGHGKMFKI